MTVNSGNNEQLRYFSFNSPKKNKKKLSMIYLFKKKSIYMYIYITGQFTSQLLCFIFYITNNI